MNDSRMALHCVKENQQSRYNMNLIVIMNSTVIKNSLWPPLVTAEEFENNGYMSWLEDHNFQLLAVSSNSIVVLHSCLPHP